MMSFTAATFVGTPEFGGFSDAAAVAVGMEKHFSRLPGIVFAIALIDASIIGACAVSLSTAYAIGDVFAVRHSLQRKPGDAKLFYTVYAGLIVVAAAFVLTPGTPLDIPPSFQELHRLRHASTSGRRDCGPRDRLG